MPSRLLPARPKRVSFFASPENLFICFWLVVGLSAAIFCIPFGVPGGFDEGMHIARAEQIARGGFSPRKFRLTISTLQSIMLLMRTEVIRSTEAKPTLQFMNFSPKVSYTVTASIPER